MSKRREDARDAAVECCKALRQWITEEDYKRTENDFSDNVYPYLERWMRLETKQCYDPPKKLKR